MVWEDFCGTFVLISYPEDVETSFDIFTSFCIENIPSSLTSSTKRKCQQSLTVLLDDPNIKGAEH